MFTLRGRRAKQRGRGGYSGAVTHLGSGNVGQLGLASGLTLHVCVYGGGGLISGLRGAARASGRTHDNDGLLHHDGQRGAGGVKVGRGGEGGGGAGVCEWSSCRKESVEGWTWWKE